MLKMKAFITVRKNLLCTPSSAVTVRVRRGSYYTQAFVPYGDNTSEHATVSVPFHLSHSANTCPAGLQPVAISSL